MVLSDTETLTKHSRWEASSRLFVSLVSHVKVIRPLPFCYHLGLLSRLSEGGHHAGQNMRPFCGKKSDCGEGAWHAGTRPGRRPARCLVCPDGPEAVYPHGLMFDCLYHPAPRGLSEQARGAGGV